MIGTFKKIWEFSGEERGNINKSVAVSFLNAVFHMFADWCNLLCGNGTDKRR